MDVLVHALEAYVATSANNFTDALAQQAIELVFEYLPKCHKPTATDQDRMSMHEHHALQDFPLTRLAWVSFMPWHISWVGNFMYLMD